MKLTDIERRRALRLLREHQRAHEDVQGYNADIFTTHLRGSMVTRALILGALIAGALYWLGGLLGALLAA